MHYGNLVIIEKPEDGDIEKAVKLAMEPHKEPGGFWDWYQIGGRWTGALSGYEPEKDEANIEECPLCGGSGKRPDMTVENGCNGCSGKGKREKWPTQWRRHDGDVIPVEDLTDEHLDKFFRVVTDYKAFGGEYYAPWKEVGEMFPKLEMPPLDWLKKNYAGHLAVVVDNHS